MSKEQEKRAGNRAGERLDNKNKRQVTKIALKDGLEYRRGLRVKRDKAIVRRRIAKAKRGSEARWDFRREIGEQEGVNPKRVILTGKMIDGKCTYIIR